MLENFNETENLFLIEEFVVISSEETDLYIDMFRMENPIENINTSNYSVKINNKYLLIKDSFRKEFRNILKIILKSRIDNNLNKKYDKFED